jgi:hypothetical protein
LPELCANIDLLYFRKGNHEKYRKERKCQLGTLKTFLVKELVSCDLRSADMFIDYLKVLSSEMDQAKN